MRLNLSNEKKEEVTFLLLNVIPEFGSELIKKRINNFSITLTEISKRSSFDIIYEN
jgi:L-rhamnose mutarotase